MSLIFPSSGTEKEETLVGFVHVSPRIWEMIKFMAGVGWGGGRGGLVRSLSILSVSQSQTESQINGSSQLETPFGQALRALAFDLR